MIDIRILKQDEKYLVSPLLENEFASNIDDVVYDEHDYFVKYVVVNYLYPHQKIAQSMFRYIENLAKNRGISDLILTSSAKRAEARAFYTKFGFSCKDTEVFKRTLRRNSI